MNKSGIVEYFAVLPGNLGDITRIEECLQIYRDIDPQGVLVFAARPTRLTQFGIVPTFEQLVNDELTARGIPRQSIRTISDSGRTTFRTARTLKAWLSENPGSQVVAVSERFRSQYYRHQFDTVLDEADAKRVRIVALSCVQCDESNWWKSRGGLKLFARSAFKLIHTICFGETKLHASDWDPEQYVLSL